MLVAKSHILNNFSVVSVITINQLPLQLPERNDFISSIFTAI